MDELLRWLPSILVVAGWIVVSHQADKREDRKEARSLVDAAKEAVIELAASGVSYHSEGKLELAIAIKSGLEALEVECERLPLFVKDCPLMGRLADFADALTGSDFESASVTKKPLDSEVILGIIRARTAFIAELERVFRVHYLGRGC